ncbi:hypothetical protein NFJ02_39g99250 [Pycnococcus provasolii]
MDDEPAPALLLDAASQRALAMEVGRLTQKLDQLHKAHQATVERCEACEEQLLDAQTRRKQLLFDNAKLTRDLTSAHVDVLRPPIVDDVADDGDGRHVVLHDRSRSRRQQAQLTKYATDDTDGAAIVLAVRRRIPFRGSPHTR